MTGLRSPVTDAMEVSNSSPKTDLVLEEGAEEAPSSSVISQRLHGFLAERGLPRHKHGSQLAVILGLSRSGAFRKFQDGSFSAGDLQTLAQHFQVDVSALLSAQPMEPPPRTDADVQARMLVGTTTIQCSATLGPALAPNEHCELVATMQGQHWDIQPFAEANALAERRRVVQVLITPNQRQLPRIAILEDSHDLALNMKDAFEASGFRAELFDSAAELMERAASAPFDAYLVDWWLSGQTAIGALQSIRMAQPFVPLVLATGAIASGHAAESEIVRLVTLLRIQVVEKPFRLALIISQVRHLVEQARAIRKD